MGRILLYRNENGKKRKFQKESLHDSCFLDKKIEDDWIQKIGIDRT
jgi:hypothetical protein